MKKILLIISALLVICNVFSQNIIFQENFDTIPYGGKVTSSTTGTTNWGINTNLYASGTRSDSCAVSIGDTIYLTTDTFSTLGKYSVYLHFNQICKIEFSDAAFIEVSIDNGANWTKLVDSMYLGQGNFGNIGNKFTATSYMDWLPVNNNAIPTNLWWKSESFDISPIAANQSTVKIRFVLIDVNNTGSAGNYGWLLDDIKVTASFSELIPPTITMVTPMIADTVYSTGPYQVKAEIIDNSGIDTALLYYTVSTGYTDTVGMTIIAPDTFSANIPFFGFGKTITYYVKAIDAAPAANADSSNSYSFYCKYSSGGSFTVGTGTVVNGSTAYPTPYGNYWWGSKHQMIIPASEMAAVNMVGGQIESVAFDVTNVNSCPGLDNFTIKIGTTNLSAITTTWESGLTTVYTNSSYQPTTGWNVHTFQTPFNWDGVSNIIVETCFNNSSYVNNGNASVNQTSTTYASTHLVYSDNANNCTAPGVGSTQNQRPNMKFVVSGVLSLNLDVGAYQITNPTGGVLANQNFPVKFNIKNYGSDSVIKTTVNWELDNVLQTPFVYLASNYDTLWADSVSAEIILDTLNLSVGSHSIKIWTLNPNDTSDYNSGNDTAYVNFYACSNLLSGNYTIGGTNPDFTNFTAAALALNQCGISGPVTFNIASGTYNEQMNLSFINGSSASNTITFQSASGDSSTVILTHDASPATENYTVNLNGTKHITFKNMTIAATDSNLCKVMQIGNMAENVHFLNNQIIGMQTSLITNEDAALIYTPDSIGDDITISNNLLQNGSIAINLVGSDSCSGKATGVLINKNIISNHFSTGIVIKNLFSPQIKQNLIETNSNHDSYDGISGIQLSGTPIITRNNIKTTNTQIAYGIRMSQCDICMSSTNSGLIANNFILINGLSTSNIISAGLLNNESRNFNYYYNTINVTGNQANAVSLCLYDATAGLSTDIKIKNNIFANQANGYTYYVTGVDTSNFIIDYNDIYNPGSGTFAYLGAAVTDFAAWKTQTSQDANSLTINPYFSSAIDLHTTNNLLNGSAIPISGITEDIDGDLRDSIAPDMGADEFSPSPYDLSAIEIIAPTDGCGFDTNEVVTVRIKNLGSATVNGGFSASYRLNSNAAVTESVSDTISAGDTLVYSFTTTVDLDVSAFHIDSTYEFKAWVDLTTDPVHYNDSTNSSVVSGYAPPAPVVSDTTILYGDSVTLTAQHLDSVFYWYEQDTSSVEIYKGEFFTTPSLYDSTTYWVEAKGGSSDTYILGTGSTINGSSSYPTAYGNYYDGNKNQYLILASELTAMGVNAGEIKSVSFDVANVNSCPALVNYEIKLKNTSATALTTTWESGLTSVYLNSSYQPVTGWNEHAFTTNFTWDGTSNLIIETCFNNTSWVSGGCASVNQTSTTFAATHEYHGDNPVVCSAPLSGTTHNQRANMKIFASSGGCPSPRVPLNVNIIGFPDEDAGISQIINPAGTAPSGVYHDIIFEITNFGYDTLESANIQWKLNGVQQDSVVWTGSLLQDSTQIVFIDSMTFNGGIYCIDAWTTMPNGVPDTINTNDTSHVCFNACLNGTYTIGDTATSANFDFPNFNSALNALTIAGICGNVTFLVDTGIYLEQLTIPSIVGTGPNASITFQGITGDSTDVILQHSSSSTSNWVVKFDGAEYISFKNMTINATGTSYSYGVYLTNGTKHCSIENCYVKSYLVTSTNGRAIIMDGGALNEYNTFRNNKIEGGYYCVYIRGVSSSVKSKYNIIEGNDLSGFNYYGLYAYYTDSTQIIGNYIHDQGGTSYTYGIYAYYIFNGFKIEKNKIILTPSTYAYGMRVSYGNYYFYASPNDAYGIVANNFVSISSGTGTNYGIYYYYNNDVRLYYNSFNISGGSALSRALYQSNTTSNTYGETIKNNIFSCTSGGYAAYYSSNNTINAVDYNDYYTTATSFVYWGGNKVDLTALQTASGKDLHSVSIIPPFTNDTNLHLTSTALSGIGTPLTEVSVDIDGDPRSPIPTMGADEKPLLPIDAGVSNIILPTPNVIVNEGASIPVQIEVTNFGTDTIKGMNIQYSVNNGTPVQYAYSDTLLPYAIDTVIMTNFISPAGNSSICAKTLLTGDTNLFNDEFCQPFFGTPTKDAYLTKIIKIDDGCNLGLDTVKIWIRNIGVDTINGPTSTSMTANYQLDGISPIVTENMNLTINPDDSALFVFSTLANFAVTTTDSVFDIVAWVNLTGDNVHYNDTAYSDVESLHTPPIPIVTSPVTVPYASPATLTASSSTGDTIIWYTDSIGGSEIHGGTTFMTPFLNYVDTTFWVEARGGVPMALYTFGTGNTTNTSSGYPTPYGNWYDGNKNHFLIRASELTAMGMSAGEIHSVAFDVANVNACPGLSNYEIKLKNTTTNTLTTSWESGLTTVYSNTSYQPVSGWNTHNFTIPFVWDGTSNIIVETCFNNTNYVSNGCASVNQTSTSFASTHEYHGDNPVVCSSPLSGNTYNQRPNMKIFAGGGGCPSTRVPINIIVSAPKACDVGVFDLVEPVSSIYMSASEQIKVLVKNYGTTAQTNIPVSYQINGGVVVTDTILTTILPNSSYNYTFGTTADLSSVGTTYHFKLYTSLSCDSVQVNDTIMRSIQNLIPNYCSSSATYTSYHDIENVTFGGINNTSTSPFNALYTDYTSVPPAMIAPSNTYPISIKINSASSYAYDGYVKVFIDYNRNGIYDQTTETAFSAPYSSASSSTPVTITGNVVISPTALNGLTQMRVVAVRSGTSTTVLPCGTYSYGETEDYSVVIAPKLLQDAGVTAITQPTTMSSSAPTPIDIIVVNYGINAIYSLDVSYQINSATPVTVTLTDTINPLDSFYYSFPAIVLPTGQNTICAYTTLVGDSNTFNDQDCITSFVQLMTPPPYSDNFEGVDYWLPDTIPNQWERGNPNAQIINSAHSPNNAWMIQLDTNYNNNSFDYLYSPNFIFGLVNPDSLSLWHNFNTETNNDGGRIQYLNNTGAWSDLGVKDDTNGTYWYNTTTSGTHMWTGNSNGWKFSSYDLSSVSDLANITQFRFIFFSNNTTNNFDGWAIDDFKITVPKLPKDAGVTNIITPIDSTMTGSNITVQVTIQNYGTDTLLSIPVNYAVTGQAATTETWTGTLLPNATDNYTFTASYSGPNSLYELCAWTSITADTHYNNDSTCKNINTIAAANDVGIIEIVTPDSITTIGSNVTVTAKIQNFGTNTVTNIPVEYDINGMNLKQETWTGSLLPNATENYTFTLTYPSPIGNYSLCVRTKLTGDADITNDEICENLLATGINEFDDSKFILFQNVPNPTKGITTISYIVPKSGKTKFEVINLLGKTIYSEENNVLAGKHQIDLDVNKLPAGIYYYSILFDGKRLVKKMIVN